MPITITTTTKASASHKVERLRGRGHYYFASLDDAMSYANQVIALHNIFLAVEAV